MSIRHPNESVTLRLDYRTSMNSLFRLLHTVPLLLCLSACSPEIPATAPESSATYYPISLDDTPLKLQLALTQSEQNKGLMHRDSMPQDHGMLFLFNQAGPRSFWMRNTRIPLDIGYFDTNGQLLEIHTLYPYDENAVHSRSQEVLIAIETNRGWFARHSMAPGAQIDLNALTDAIIRRGNHPALTHLKQLTNAQPSRNDCAASARKRPSLSQPQQTTRPISGVSAAPTDVPPRARLRAYLALITLVILVFSPLMLSDVLWSDYDSVERSAYTSMDSWQQAWTIDHIRQYDPITISSYFLEDTIPLPTPAVHRGINILLHILAAILLLKNLESLKLPAAFSAALIFALHPASIQTLFWAGYRSEIIALIFILSALYFGGLNRHKRDAFLTILLTTIACIIHPAAFAIPVILALLILNQKHTLHAHSFNRVLPLICLCLFLAVWLKSGNASIETGDALSATDRLNHAGQNMAYFTRQALAPLNNALFHPFNKGANYEIGAQMSLLPFLLFVPFFILIACNIRKNWSRAILLGLCSYLLLIIYGIFLDGEFIDGTLAHEDHHLYVALPMIIALVITAAGRLIYNMGAAGKPLWLMGCSVLLLIEISLTATFAYSLSEPARMWSTLSERWPDAWQPKLAQLDLVEQSDHSDTPTYTNSELIKRLESVLKQRPDLIAKRKQLARIFASEGQQNNALREYKRILRESTPDNDFLDEAAEFLDQVGQTWEASKTRERKTNPQK